ncbi:MAG TPA: hypothetical protein DEB73_02075 [Candidatus Magasanikbacteria bacterium]|uniref:Cyclodipeptide synthase n=1 Tax=Candidatus Magasanikbacteria bacterium GW2011_GWA2_42_32 TaxID=1619039 RepID=A0A0G1D3Z1_9BACT|nr:MAG: hypothetical protein UT86_C0009G0009 [Candidatus Magasanikbacteria bacterium GW2011_GWC2_40_17]KKS56728.1 MAG: hypothetical protein UV20_C0006G0011 [Candidatus Magasanikbacteria bacterium GW2011_GWA2_42_32]OGH85983.1 MAG: hypothetical protein A2294_03370 [Candidatus Magasanikbacteria bacterium RIFOXYB2_FULL_38_10]HBV58030.1 hypothetical protein [Candidatus Magasanikbacteria bacterium]
MKSGFDINLIEGDGYLILPISMARISAGQSPEEIYEMFHFFAKKLKSFTNDVVLLYTNGLYFNAEDITHNQRVKSNQQIIDHSYKLRQLIEKRKEYIPNAFHFLPIDYVILNAPRFREYFYELKKQEKTDDDFRKSIKNDIGKREYTEANVNFILEEIIVAHIMREKEIEFPRTLVRNDSWRLIAYPGAYMEADLYQWKKNWLPKKDSVNPFVDSHYNFNEKKIYRFSEL